MPDMLTYNTRLPRLVLPEYGRNIQRMVDHCVGIADREERNRCAHAIITAMSRIAPQIANSEEYRHKLWDHLAIMSEFKLDIDWPCEIVRPDDFATTPDPIGDGTGDFRYRHYGKYVELMIAKAMTMQPGQERDSLVNLLANHMKKLQLEVNPEGVDDEKIFRDLAELSHGEFRLDPQTVKLHEFKAAPEATTSKKKKKKNKQQLL